MGWVRSLVKEANKYTQNAYRDTHITLNVTKYKHLKTTAINHY
jgi:hypothetical protein